MTSLRRSYKSITNKPLCDSSTYRCQKCLEKGHYTYECKGKRKYISRPSRTVILHKKLKGEEGAPQNDPNSPMSIISDNIEVKSNVPIHSSNHSSSDTSEDSESDSSSTTSSDSSRSSHSSSSSDSSRSSSSSSSSSDSE
ncbi:uncharacterized protein CEXT_307291 [Caerostris extrusa]|uniref:Zinc finger CCHC domain-containing protein 10 n=1 Tax=Caerostris extrusa TaxID=172846 RepID=A0AAV4X027_CAEEX|nr:uncharacterized protein CEXT_307291 [Caerostris extrusa]